MQLAVVAAGFTPGEADRLRRAMAAWKRKGGLGPFEERLIRGMRERGYAEEFARQIFRQILGFGEYGFPECVVGETRVVDADTGRWPTIDEIVSGRARLGNTLACDDQLRLRKRKVRRRGSERREARMAVAYGAGSYDHCNGRASVHDDGWMAPTRKTSGWRLRRSSALHSGLGSSPMAAPSDPRPCRSDRRGQSVPSQYVLFLHDRFMAPR